MVYRWFLGVVVAALTALAAAPARAGDGAVSVLVTTSMLEQAIGELALPAGSLSVKRLMPPGGCPGHFDLSPGVLADLRQAPVLLLHDYQAGLAAQVRRVAGDSVTLLEVPTAGSLLVPTRYARLVEETASLLGARHPQMGDAVAAGSTAAGVRLAALEAEMREQAAAWRDAPVIASAQQRDFCAWLGLRVVGELPRPEDLSPRQLGALSRAGAVLVIGNLQSDADAAQVLGRRLGLPTATLSNFPGAEGYGRTYADLVGANLGQVTRAWTSRN